MIPQRIRCGGADGSGAVELQTVAATRHVFAEVLGEGGSQSGQAAAADRYGRRTHFLADEEGFAPASPSGDQLSLAADKRIFRWPGSP